MRVALFAVVGLAFACSGCLGGASTPPPKPEAAVTVSNKDYKVDRLFTDDQKNSIYRFYDQGNTIYYLTHPGGESRVIAIVEPPPETSSGGGGDFMTTSSYCPPGSHGGHKGGGGKGSGGGGKSGGGSSGGGGKGGGSSGGGGGGKR
ncbi:MAG TPA: hypothetical protein VEA69_10815 [Tepidisphaeraceae bacterium]|nr:hypothetical protein [Tepidisphaeraceae bacterium]